METTVKIQVADFLLPGVIFGGISYKIGEEVNLDFQGEGILLFDRRSGRMMAQGSLKTKS
jgi:hypothetical protein